MAEHKCCGNVYDGSDLPLADYRQAVEYLQKHQGIRGQRTSGVMLTLRDVRAPEKLLDRWACLCRDSCSYDSREYRITRETLQQLRDAGQLSDNTYVGYNRWCIYDYIGHAARAKLAEEALQACVRLDAAKSSGDMVALADALALIYDIAARLAALEATCNS